MLNNSQKQTDTYRKVVEIQNSIDGDFLVRYFIIIIIIIIFILFLYSCKNNFTNKQKKKNLESGGTASHLCEGGSSHGHVGEADGWRGSGRGMGTRSHRVGVHVLPLQRSDPLRRPKEEVPYASQGRESAVRLQGLLLAV